MNVSPPALPARKTLHVQMLGQLKIQMAGEYVSGLSRQCSAIVAYLALHPGRRISREQLAEQFWPDGDLESARARLRQCLLRIRRTLVDPVSENDAPIIVDADFVEVRTGAVSTEVPSLAHF